MAFSLSFARRHGGTDKHEPPAVATAELHAGHLEEPQSESGSEDLPELEPESGGGCAGDAALLPTPWPGSLEEDEPRAAYDAERNEFRFRRGIDESGFPEEAEPLRYVPDDTSAQDGVEYEVVTERMAIRKLPRLDSRIFGVALQRDRLLLYRQDASRTWGQTHFRLRGGYGNLVEAWVMLRHETLGILLTAVDVHAAEGMGHSRHPEFTHADHRPSAPTSNATDGAAGSLPEVAGRDLKDNRSATAGHAGAAAPITEPDRKSDETIWELQTRYQLAAAASTGSHWNSILVAKRNEVELQALRNRTIASDGLKTEEGSVQKDGAYVLSPADLQRAARTAAVEFEVRRPAVRVHSNPFREAACLGSVSAGAHVDTFGGDSKGQWYKVYLRHTGNDTFAAGWMLLGRYGTKLMTSADASPGAAQPAADGAARTARLERNVAGGALGAARPLPEPAARITQIAKNKAWLLMNHDALITAAYVARANLIVSDADDKEVEGLTLEDGMQMRSIDGLLGDIQAGAARYKVVLGSGKLPVRSVPQVSGKVVSTLVYDTLIDTYGEDASQSWCRVYGMFSKSDVFAAAWVKMEHPMLGQLLEKV